jgi:hypothetical protein
MSRNLWVSSMKLWAQSRAIKLTWPKLAKWNASFVPKAITFFSLASFGLAYFGPLLRQYGLSEWKLAAWLIGSVSFLIGYAIVEIRMPSEFSGGALDLEEIVARMRTVDSKEYYESRKDMTIGLIPRMEPFKNIKDVKAAIDEAADFSAKEVKPENWAENAAPLYYADLLLRQYDRPVERLLSVIFMAIGLSLLFLPTLTNFVHAVGELLGV